MFITEYIKDPSRTGAVSPSSKYVADKMLKDIKFSNSKVIVEYGPGTGVFTEKILARVSNDTKVILIEINKHFYNVLKRLYGHKNNVIILNDSVENVDNILEKYSIKEIDYIISGLPFASLPKETSDRILSKTKKILKNKGEFITFQYTLLKRKYLNMFLDEVSVDREVRNIPPAYVLRFKGKLK
ncbi:class I SAM-dependent methyltransferase [Clostridium tertium]